MSLVSIIINCHNGAKFLEDCLNSVYNQTYQNYEVIFYNNCSNDESEKIFNRYKREKDIYFISKNFLSLGEARFNAVNLASGDYISFIDVDDIWFKDKLERQISKMESEKSFLSFSNVLLKNENSKTLTSSKIKSNINFSDLITNYQIYMPTVVIKKTNFNFEKKLHYCPDYLLFMKYIINFKFTFLENNLAIYRYHPNSFSNSKYIKSKQYYEEIYTLGVIRRICKKINLIDIKFFKIRMSQIMINRAAYYFYTKKFTTRKILKKKLFLFPNMIKFILIYLLLHNYIPFVRKLKKITLLF